MSSLDQVVRRRAGNRCEYCRISQVGFKRQFHIEHIVARQHGGETRLDNLALACWTCNFKKGPNLSGIDPQTGRIVLLFHPRRDKWQDHFSSLVDASGAPEVAIHGLTDIGRATVQLLGFNEDVRRLLRYEFWLEGLYFADKQ